MILSRAQADFFGAHGVLDRRRDQGFVHHRLCRPGLARPAFSSMMRASSDWSRLPQLTPMRTGLS
jgi:hypothetical protein